MMPLDQVQPATTENQNPMAPQATDDNPNIAMVEKGLRIAENEKRDAIVDSYEEAALSSENTQEALDDIDYQKAQDNLVDPELAAMREQISP